MVCLSFLFLLFLLFLLSSVQPLNNKPLINRRPKREQRLLADYASQVGGKDTEGGLTRVWEDCTHRWRLSADSLSTSLDLAFLYNKKSQVSKTWLKEAATYSPTTKCSTIGVSELNFSVRNGKRWDLTAITTLILSISSIVIRVHQH